MRTTSGRKYVRQVGMQWGHVPARNEDLERGLLSASETWCPPNRWFPLCEVMMQRDVATYCNTLLYIYMCVRYVLSFGNTKTCHTIIKTCSMPTFVLICPGQKILLTIVRGLRPPEKGCDMMWWPVLPKYYPPSLNRQWVSKALAGFEDGRSAARRTGHDHCQLLTLRQLGSTSVEMPGFLVFTNGAEGLIDPQPEGQAGVDHQMWAFLSPGSGCAIWRNTLGLSERVQGRTWYSLNPLLIIVFPIKIIKWSEWQWWFAIILIHSQTRLSFLWRIFQLPGFRRRSRRGCADVTAS